MRSQAPAFARMLAFSLAASCVAFAPGAAGQSPDAGAAQPEPIVSLDFKDTTPTALPKGWLVEGDAAKTRVQVRRAEKGSAYLELRGNSSDPTFVYTVIPAKACHKRASVSFEFRASIGGGTASGIFLRPSLPRPLLGPSIAGTREWQRVEFETAEADCLERSLGAGVLLSGDVDVRKFTLRRDGQKVVSPRHPPVDANDGDALVASRLDAQEFWNRIRLSNIDVVALGEASHGAAGLFALKFEVVKAAASSGEAITFALEMPAAAGDIVNDFVLGRTDDADLVVDALVYPAWQTEEMLEIVTWLRAHNATAARSVRFAGFDVQHPIWAARKLMDFGVDKEALNSILQGGEQASLQVELESLASQLAGRPEALRYLRLLRRGLIVDQADLGGASRSTYMADELLRIAQTQKGRVIAWADNTHVTKVPGSMGAQLEERIGDHYLAVGMTFADGEYSSYGPANPYEAETAYHGTHEEVLAATGMDRNFVFLSDLAAEHALREPLGWRYIGSTPQEYGQFLPHSLPHHFDAIGFVETSEATNFLRENDF